MGFLVVFSTPSFLPFKTHILDLVIITALHLLAGSCSSGVWSGYWTRASPLYRPTSLIRDLSLF
jgi:hypothetical protein